MKKNNITGRNAIVQRGIDLFPKWLRLRTNPDRYAIEKFINKISKKIEPNSSILDAGAGPCPYKKYFAHCNYESTDFKKEEGIDFVSNLSSIPRKNNSYDAVLCTEVLEHVESPSKVLSELHRILKKSGKIYLTVPQGRTIHQEPFNFFYFTKYGILSLLKNAGFKNIKISPKGGWFWFMADAIRFNNILSQYKKWKILYYPLRFIEFPFTSVLIPFVLFHLDFIDKDKKWTCGYLVEAEK